jgi:hypothetical protein
MLAIARRFSLPMQADAALGFVLGGLALIAFDRGRRLWTLSLAGFLFAFALLAVIEFTVRGDFGIHQRRRPRPEAHRAPPQGAAAMIGARGMASLCEQLAKLAVSESFETASALIASLQKEYIRVQHALERERRGAA